MSEHTLEPWAIFEDSPWIIKMPEPSNLGDGSKYAACGGGNNEANAQRIVACVNACEGVPTDMLTPGAVHHWWQWADEVDEIPNLTAERDQLQAELGAINNALGIVDHCQIIPLVSGLQAEVAEAVKLLIIVRKHLPQISSLPNGKTEIGNDTKMVDQYLAKYQTKQGV